MAIEISRTYDTNLAAVIVQIQDEFGNVSPHTIHVMNSSVCPTCGTRLITAIDGSVDVDATVGQIIADTDTATTTIKQKMQAAGWVAPSQPAPPRP